MSDLLIFIRNSVEPNMWLNVNDNREFLTQNNFRCESFENLQKWITHSSNLGNNFLA
jgi:hypothetical protein